MGACAGCMGPQRREDNYKVNRLTENSPIKSRVTPSQLPVSRQKDRIIEELNESKRRLQGNSLINQLIGSPGSNIYNAEINATESKIIGNYINPRQSHEILGRDSYIDNAKLGKSSMFTLRKVVESIDQNLQNKYYDGSKIEGSKFMKEGSKFMREGSKFVNGGQNSRPFTSEFRTSTRNDMVSYDEEPDYKSALSQIKLNRNTSPSKFIKKGLRNIPELPDQDSKTPNYVKQIRKQNGQDVRRTDLDGSFPIKLQQVPSINIQKYLKDLQ